MDLFDIITSDITECRICKSSMPKSIPVEGREIQVKYNSDICLDCNSMSKVMSNSSGNEYYINDGTIYFTRKKKHSKGIKGFNGKQFTIYKISDRKFIKTDDLWLYGPVTPSFKDKLPDNCVINPDPKEKEFATEETQEE